MVIVSLATAVSDVRPRTVLKLIYVGQILGAGLNPVRNANTDLELG
jgi:hypothetical protein